MAEPPDEFNEPSGITAGLDSDDHVAGEGSIETADIIPLVVQLGEAYLTADRVAVTNSLLTRVKVHTTINSHGHLLRGLMRKVSLPQLARASRRCLLHHITAVGSGAEPQLGHAGGGRCQRRTLTAG